MLIIQTNKPFFFGILRPNGIKQTILWSSHVFFQATQGIAEAIIYLSTLGAGVTGGETVFPVALDPQVEGR